MRRELALVLLVASLCLAGWSDESASACPDSTTETTLNGQIRVDVVQSDCPEELPGSEPAVPASTQLSTSEINAIINCYMQAVEKGTDPGACGGIGPSPTAMAGNGTPAQVTPGMVATAFRRIALPKSVLVVQPPRGRTLVNFETNFYTEQSGFTRSVVLLGQRVDLRVTPSVFTWRFGDEVSSRSSGPGSPYPDLEVTHRYLRKGSVRPSVDTTYTADFRVGGGAWAPVPGTVTVVGDPVALDVVTATPVLVG